MLVREEHADYGSATHARAYSYLLGMYLGDGHIAHSKRSYRLQIYLHASDRAVIARVARTIRLLLPDRSVTFISHHGAVAVSTYFAGWPWLFPQHGPGRKHTRPIRFEAWQADIVDRYPTEFVRGCIDSDGCRHRRIVNGKDYPAYSFSNRSEEILALFTAACDRLGIRWRRANQETISIARRPDVARLDAMFSDADAGS